MKNETVLWAVKPESKNWEEDIIVSVDAENPNAEAIIQKAMAWAREKGEYMYNNIKIINVDYHRNGISGQPFVSILFTDKVVGEDMMMIATIFTESRDCAVYSVPLLAEGDNKFGSNSWRGDEYYNMLKETVDNFLKE